MLLASVAAVGVTAVGIFVRSPQGAHVGPNSVINESVVNVFVNVNVVNESVINVFVNTCICDYGSWRIWFVLGRWGRRRVAYGNMLVEDASTSPLRLPVEDMVLPTFTHT